MESVGPFLFNGIRFALGALTLLPIVLLRSKGSVSGNSTTTNSRPKNPRSDSSMPRRFYVVAGLVTGGVLFLGSSLQQMGLVYTTAGKAGFITGLYVVLVPLFGMFLGSRPGAARWIGAVVAVAGLYFLSVQESFTVARGDLLVISSAFFWAAHVLALAAYSPRGNSLILALAQYLVCSILSLAVGLTVEPNTLEGVLQATIPIVYGGCFSVGVAYTLQVVAQRNAHPAHAAIILSLEGAFAALGGRLLIGELLSSRALVGCVLMFAGMVTSQLAGIRFLKRPRTEPSLSKRSHASD